MFLLKVWGIAFKLNLQGGKMEFKIAKPKPIFIRKSIIRDFFNEKEMWFSTKTTKQLNKTMEEILLKAIERAKLNRRKTILPQDCI